MEVFNIKDHKVEVVELNPFKLERDIQVVIEKNTESFFGLEFVRSEFPIGEFRIDTLCYDNETNSFVLIEYKKGSSYSVIDQGYSYLSLMLNNKSEFIIEYNERLNKTLKRDDVDWTQSRILFISPLAKVALLNPAPKRVSAVVCPEKPLAIAALTSTTLLPVAALTSKATARAFWL